MSKDKKAWGLVKTYLVLFGLIFVFIFPIFGILEFFHNGLGGMLKAAVYVAAVDNSVCIATVAGKYFIDKDLF